MKLSDEFDNCVKRKVIFLNIFSNLVQLAGMDADEKYADFPRDHYYIDARSLKM